MNVPQGSLVEKHIDGSSTMRILHYPPQKNSIIKKNQIRGGAHTDYGSITLLWRFDDVPGLQIYDKGNDEWIDAPIIENSLVLNVADMFARWTNDILKSTPHRIVNADLTRPRYSMPYFVDPGRDVMIENMTSQPSKYRPISAYEYLKWRLAQSYIDDNYKENTNISVDSSQHLPEESNYSSS